MKENEEYTKLLYQNLKKYYFHELGLEGYEESIELRLQRRRGKAVVAKIGNYYPLKRRKVLEVGSGWGEICVEAAKSGAMVAGIEPDHEELRISKLLAEIERVNVNLMRARGEDIPFHDNTFDILICWQVIEHVCDVAQTISEMIRVTKHGGVICLNTPNYLYPVEGHYKMVYPSMFPKSLVRIYLKLRRRKPDYINHINFVTTFGIFSELEKYGVRIRNIGLEEYRQQKGKNVLIQLLRWFLIKSKLYPNIQLFIEKK